MQPKLSQSVRLEDATVLVFVNHWANMLQFDITGPKTLPCCAVRFVAKFIRFVTKKTGCFLSKKFKLMFLFKRKR